MARRRRVRELKAVMDKSLTATLIALAKLTRALHSIHMQRIGLVSGQDELLSVLASAGPQRITGIADAMNVRPSTVSKMCDRLEEVGLIERKRAEIDARATEVWLTEAGRRKHGDAVDALDAMEKEISVDRKVFKGESYSELTELITHLQTRLRRLR